MLSSVFGLARSSHSTKHLKTCCYAMSCTQQAALSGLLQAGEILLSSDRQELAYPRRQTTERNTVLLYNSQILPSMNYVKDKVLNLKFNFSMCKTTLINDTSTQLFKQSVYHG